MQTAADDHALQRLQQLERTLARIANELRAVGIEPAGDDAQLSSPDAVLSRLTPREREVVLRLIDGDRVPSIAASLFVSQSTVRNVLSAVYRRLGVHGQQELVNYLKGRSDGPSTSR